MKPIHNGLAPLAFALVLIGCGGASVEMTDCNDGIDNDDDGYTDDQDPGCELNMGEREAPDPTQCSDGLDNDGDSLIDGDDWGCDGTSDDEEADPTRECNDGADNDGDGFIDFGQDPGCENPVDTTEFNPAACGDSMDNDNDGRIDYPFDAGCDSLDDVDETDPSPLPACSDGIDNDGDMLVDFGQDPGCTAAADNDEFHPIPGACGPGLTVMDLTPTGEATGTISGPLPNELTSGSCNGYGGEFAYQYSVVSGPRALVISTDYPETTLDTIIYVRTECRRADTELGCDDDGGVAARTSELILPLVNTGTYYVIVDSFSPGSLGDFKVTVSERNPLHGPCDPADPEACVPGLICRPLLPGDPNTCEYHACGDSVDNDGDGIVDFPFEPGCTSDLDDTEDDPVPAPQCGNGIDDDGDTFVDYPADPGCDNAADAAEIDECVPGAPVLSHPGGTVSGTTVGGSSVLAAPTVSGCDPFGATATSPERVYYYQVTNDLTQLRLSTEGSGFDTVLYVRVGDCSVPGTGAMCNDNGAGTQSVVTIADPAPGGYFAIVDGRYGGAGLFNLRISGTIDVGGACIVSDPDFVCTAGSACDATTSVCEPAQCNDAIDNDGDMLIDYPFEPGCTSISDDDETDPVPPPQCGDGLDNDMDGMIDYPADDSCGSASDDDESCAVFGTNVFGYQGCQDTLGAIPPCPDLATTGTMACTGDDCLTTVTIPFSFNFFGTNHTSLSVISNGKIGFPGTTSYSNSCTIEANTIAVYWDDLYPPSGGAVRYANLGTAPNRQFAVQWNIPHISGGGLYDIRAVLYEGSNDIDVCYVNTQTGTVNPGGSSATTGINGVGDMLSFSCNTATVVNGLLLHYEYP